MIVSEARLAANRLNARKSTGPTTDEGKERSRCNAVKHGLTGEGVALSTEDAAAVEARLAGYQASYRPATEAGQDLVRRAAMLSVRLERCAIREAAAISKNVRAAESDFDEGREAEVDALFEDLEGNPAVAVRRLVRMPEGIDRMVDTWSDLRADLAVGDGSRWTPDHGEIALRLTGRKPGGLGVGRAEALSPRLRRRFLAPLRRGRRGARPRGPPRLGPPVPPGADRHGDRAAGGPPSTARLRSDRGRPRRRRRPGALRPLEGGDPRPQVRGGGRARPPPGPQGDEGDRGRGTGRGDPGRRDDGFVSPGAGPPGLDARPGPSRTLLRGPGPLALCPADGPEARSGPVLSRLGPISRRSSPTPGRPASRARLGGYPVKNYRPGDGSWEMGDG